MNAESRPGCLAGVWQAALARLGLARHMSGEVVVINHDVAPAPVSSVESAVAPTRPSRRELRKQRMAEYAAAQLAGQSAETATKRKRQRGSKSTTEPTFRGLNTESSSTVLPPEPKPVKSRGKRKALNYREAARVLQKVGFVQQPGNDGHAAFVDSEGTVVGIPRRPTNKTISDGRNNAVWKAVDGKREGKGRGKH